MVGRLDPSWVQCSSGHLKTRVKPVLNFAMFRKRCVRYQNHVHRAQGKTLGFLKFMITQQRVPISAVSMTINGKWQSLVRSGDGFWQPTQYDSNNPQVSTRRHTLQPKVADPSQRCYLCLHWRVLPVNMLGT